MYPNKTIYLAGPITGCDYNSARYGWRKDFADILFQIQFERVGANPWLHCFSPMREKEFLEKDQCISGTADYESLHGFGTPHGILTRDHNDVRNCDAMIACFLGAKRVSVGTCVEFGFAHAYRKPLIMVMEDARSIAVEPHPIDGPGSTIIKNPHDHVFLRACAGYVVPTLKHAAEIAYSLLTPGM
jgi:nucleoside 2-deoxyribosyltransferase